jgi:hypothetical protein
VVKRRSGVDANESGSIHGAADDLQGAATQNGEHQQYNEAGDAENQADSMRNAVRQFLDLDCGPSCAIAIHLSLCFHFSLLPRRAQ